MADTGSRCGIAVFLSYVSPHEPVSSEEEFMRAAIRGRRFVETHGCSLHFLSDGLWVARVHPGHSKRECMEWVRRHVARGRQVTFCCRPVFDGRYTDDGMYPAGTLGPVVWSSDMRQLMFVNVRGCAMLPAEFLKLAESREPGSSVPALLELYEDLVCRRMFLDADTPEALGNATVCVDPTGYAFMVLIEPGHQAGMPLNELAAWRSRQDPSISPVRTHELRFPCLPTSGWTVAAVGLPVQYIEGGASGDDKDDDDRTLTDTEDEHDDDKTVTDSDTDDEPMEQPVMDSIHQDVPMEPSRASVPEPDEKDADGDTIMTPKPRAKPKTVRKDVDAPDNSEYPNFCRPPPNLTIELELLASYIATDLYNPSHPPFVSLDSARRWVGQDAMNQGRPVVDMGREAGEMLHAFQFDVLPKDAVLPTTEEWAAGLPNAVRFELLLPGARADASPSPAYKQSMAQAFLLQLWYAVRCARCIVAFDERTIGISESKYVALRSALLWECETDMEVLVFGQPVRLPRGSRPNLDWMVQVLRWCTSTDHALLDLVLQQPLDRQLDVVLRLVLQMDTLFSTSQLVLWWTGLAELPPSQRKVADEFIKSQTDERARRMYAQFRSCLGVFITNIDALHMAQATTRAYESVNGAGRGMPAEVPYHCVTHMFRGKRCHYDAVFVSQQKKLLDGNDPAGVVAAESKSIARIVAQSGGSRNLLTTLTNEFAGVVPGRHVQWEGVLDILRKWQNTEKNGPGHVLADQPGLGKTGQAVTILQRFINWFKEPCDDAGTRFHLIVVPRVTMLNFRAELCAFAPQKARFGVTTVTNKDLYDQVDFSESDAAAGYKDMFIVTHYNVLDQYFRDLQYLCSLPFTEQLQRMRQVMLSALYPDFSNIAGRIMRDTEPLLQNPLQRADFVTGNFEHVPYRVLATALTAYKRAIAGPVLGVTKYHTVVLDEAHNLRNTNSTAFQLSQYLCDRSARVLLLTGTPIYGHYTDIVSVLQLCRVPWREDWDEKYLTRRDARGQNWMNSNLASSHDVGMWDNEAQLKDGPAIARSMRALRNMWYNTYFLSTAPPASERDAWDFTYFVEALQSDDDKAMVFASHREERPADRAALVMTAEANVQKIMFGRERIARKEMPVLRTAAHHTFAGNVFPEALLAWMNPADAAALDAERLTQVVAQSTIARMKSEYRWSGLVRAVLLNSCRNLSLESRAELNDLRKALFADNITRRNIPHEVLPPRQDVYVSIPMSHAECSEMLRMCDTGPEPGSLNEGLAKVAACRGAGEPVKAVMYVVGSKTLMYYAKRVHDNMDKYLGPDDPLLVVYNSDSDQTIASKRQKFQQAPGSALMLVHSDLALRNHDFWMDWVKHCGLLVRTILMVPVKSKDYMQMLSEKFEEADQDRTPPEGQQFPVPDFLCYIHGDTRDPAKDEQYETQLSLGIIQLRKMTGIKAGVPDASEAVNVIVDKLVTGNIGVSVLAFAHTESDVKRYKELIQQTFGTRVQERKSNNRKLQFVSKPEQLANNGSDIDSGAVHVGVWNRKSEAVAKKWLSASVREHQVAERLLVLPHGRWKEDKVTQVRDKTLEGVRDMLSVSKLQKFETAYQVYAPGRFHQPSTIRWASSKLNELFGQDPKLKAVLFNPEPAVREYYTTYLEQTLPQGSIVVHMKGSSETLETGALTRFRQHLGNAVLLIGNTGREGLNLQDASVFIMDGRQWTVAEELQLIGRVHRRGQTKPVVVYFPMLTTHDTNVSPDHVYYAQSIVKAFKASQLLARDLFYDDPLVRSQVEAVRGVRNQDLAAVVVSDYMRSVLRKSLEEYAPVAGRVPDDEPVRAVYNSTGALINPIILKLMQQNLEGPDVAEEDNDQTATNEDPDTSDLGMDAEPQSLVVEDTPHGAALYNKFIDKYEARAVSLLATRYGVPDVDFKQETNEELRLQLWLRNSMFDVGRLAFRSIMNSPDPIRTYIESRLRLSKPQSEDDQPQKGSDAEDGIVLSDKGALDDRQLMDRVGMLAKLMVDRKALDGQGRRAALDHLVTEINVQMALSDAVVQDDSWAAGVVKRELDTSSAMKAMVFRTDALLRKFASVNVRPHPHFYPAVPIKDVPGPEGALQFAALCAWFRFSEFGTHPVTSFNGIQERTEELEKPSKQLDEPAVDQAAAVQVRNAAKYMYLDMLRFIMRTRRNTYIRFTDRPKHGPDVVDVATRRQKALELIVAYLRSEPGRHAEAAQALFKFAWVQFVRSSPHPEKVTKELFESMNVPAKTLLNSSHNRHDEQAMSVLLCVWLVEWETFFADKTPNLNPLQLAQHMTTVAIPFCDAVRTGQIASTWTRYDSTVLDGMQQQIAATRASGRAGGASVQQKVDVLCVLLPHMWVVDGEWNPRLRDVCADVYNAVTSTPMPYDEPLSTNGALAVALMAVDGHVSGPLGVVTAQCADLVQHADLPLCGGHALATLVYEFLTMWSPEDIRRAPLLTQLGALLQYWDLRVNLPSQRLFNTQWMTTRKQYTHATADDLVSSFGRPTILQEEPVHADTRFQADCLPSSLAPVFGPMHAADSVGASAAFQPVLTGLVGFTEVQAPRNLYPMKVGEVWTCMSPGTKTTWLTADNQGDSPYTVHRIMTSVDGARVRCVLVMFGDQPASQAKYFVRLGFDPEEDGYVLLQWPGPAVSAKAKSYVCLSTRQHTMLFRNPSVTEIQIARAWLKCLHAGLGGNGALKAMEQVLQSVEQTRDVPSMEDVGKWQLEGSQAQVVARVVKHVLPRFIHSPVFGDSAYVTSVSTVPTEESPMVVVVQEETEWPVLDAAPTLLELQQRQDGRFTDADLVKVMLLYAHATYRADMCFGLRTGVVPPHEIRVASLSDSLDITLQFCQGLVVNVTECAYVPIVFGCELSPAQTLQGLLGDSKQSHYEYNYTHNNPSPAEKLAALCVPDRVRAALLQKTESLKDWVTLLATNPLFDAYRVPASAPPSVLTDFTANLVGVCAPSPPAGGPTDTYYLTLVAAMLGTAIGDTPYMGVPQADGAKYRAQYRVLCPPYCAAAVRKYAVHGAAHASDSDMTNASNLMDAVARVCAGELNSAVVFGSGFGEADGEVHPVGTSVRMAADLFPNKRVLVLNLGLNFSQSQLVRFFDQVLEQPSKANEERVRMVSFMPNDADWVVRSTHDRLITVPADKPTQYFGWYQRQRSQILALAGKSMDQLVLVNWSLDSTVLSQGASVSGADVQRILIDLQTSLKSPKIVVYVEASDNGRVGQYMWQAWEKTCQAVSGVMPMLLYYPYVNEYLDKSRTYLMPETKQPKHRRTAADDNEPQGKTQRLRTQP